MYIYIYIVDIDILYIHIVDIDIYISCLWIWTKLADDSGGSLPGAWALARPGEGNMGKPAGKPEKPMENLWKTYVHDFYGFLLKERWEKPADLWLNCYKKSWHKKWLILATNFWFQQEKKDVTRTHVRTSIQDTQQK